MKLKITMAQAIKDYRESFKKFNGYEPTINPEMTVRELIAHANIWRRYVKEMEINEQ